LLELSFRHFKPEVVTFTGTLAYTGENGYTGVLNGDVSDELLHRNRLANTCTTEETNLSTLEVWAEEVNNLDTGFENFRLGSEVFECRCIAVDWRCLLSVCWTTLIDWATENVENTSKGCRSNRNGDWLTRVIGRITADETVRGVHCDTTNEVVAEVLSDFDDQRVAATAQRNFNCIQNRRQIAWLECDVHNGTCDLNEFTGCHGCVILRRTLPAVEHWEKTGEFYRIFGILGNSSRFGAFAPNHSSSYTRHRYRCA
jgi:hypothetical protein